MDSSAKGQTRRERETQSHGDCHEAALPNGGTMRRYLLVATITLLVASANSTSTSAVARTTSLPAFGSVFHGMWGQYTDEQRIVVLDKLAAAGVRWVRIDFGWSSFEPQAKGVYAQWYIDRTQFLLDAAKARGIKVLAMLWRTPAWANGGKGVYDPPTNPKDYGDFVAWFGQRFRDQVAAYEIWNEPDLLSFWTGTQEQYVGLLKAAYPRLKAVDPRAPVLIAGTTYNRTPWLAAALSLGAGPYFDVVATHPYMGIADQPPETPDTTGKNIWLMDHAAAVHKLIPNKPIWFTEFGWSSHENTGGEKNWQRGVSEATQADYLVRAIEFVRMKHPYVEVMFWYAERDEMWQSTLHKRHYGLLYEDLKPKPAYMALNEYL